MPCDHDREHNLTENQIIDEMYYRDMMRKIVPGWLPHRDYSHLIKSVHYKGMVNNTMKFFVPNRFNGWFFYIRFDEWNEVLNDMSMNAVEASRLLFGASNNIKLNCSCPAYLFWGYQYIETQVDAAIVPETRYPYKRNPNLKGFVCKHGIRVLKVLPYHLGDLAHEIKKQRARLK